MERRVFIAVLMSFVVLYTYQTYFAPPPPDTPPAGSKPIPATAAAPAAGSAPSAASAPAAPATTPSEPAPVSVLGETQPREITVETATVRVVFSNRGARAVRWQLKHYRDTGDQLVDLVPSGLPDSEPRPFSLQVDDAKETERLNTAMYRVTGDQAGTLDASRGEPLVFEFQDENGLSARKEFRFDPTTYTLTATVTVRRGDTPLNPAIVWGPGLGDQGAAAGGGSIFTGNAVMPPRALIHHGGEITRLTPEDAAEAPRQPGPFRFVGVDDHYFVSFAVSDLNGTAEYRPLMLPGATEGEQRRLLAYTLKPATPGEPIRFFVGPKQFDELQALGPDYTRAIDFGIFAWLVVPLLSTLKWLFRFTGNYGWSIILLTIVINLVMFPLRHKSSVAMRKMQAIQPQMKLIQERYSHLKMTDPGRQKMQEEVTALYRERGVNPASGCLPLVLTLPVLMAFYSLLAGSIELRGAPFAGWLRDLSAADPYFVLPSLMGLTMFWQQKVTPTTADPAQQRVMMVMPVMFTAMMLFSASGVVLYWFVSQVWAIGQQYLTNWMVPLAAPAKPPAAAARRAK